MWESHPRSGMHWLSVAGDIRRMGDLVSCLEVALGGDL